MPGRRNNGSPKRMRLEDNAADRRSDEHSRAVPVPRAVFTDYVHTPMLEVDGMGKKTWLDAILYYIAQANTVDLHMLRLGPDTTTERVAQAFGSHDLGSVMWNDERTDYTDYVNSIPTRGRGTLFAINPANLGVPSTGPTEKRVCRGLPGVRSVQDRNGLVRVPVCPPALPSKHVPLCGVPWPAPHWRDRVHGPRSTPKHRRKRLPQRPHHLSRPHTMQRA